MTILTGSASTTSPASPDDVFDVLTDPARLSAWNRIMTDVVEAPPSLTPGCDWVVAFKAMGVMRWRSRSRCEHVDRAAHRLVYRSGTDDENPSYALWRWTVEDGPDGGSRIHVEWELHPLTFWRRLLLSRMRQRMLRQEVQDSLRALAETSASPPV